MIKVGQSDVHHPCCCCTNQHTPVSRHEQHLHFFVFLSQFLARGDQNWLIRYWHRVYHAILCKQDCLFARRSVRLLSSFLCEDGSNRHDLHELSSKRKFLHSEDLAIILGKKKIIKIHIMIFFLKWGSSIPWPRCNQGCLQERGQIVYQGKLCDC